MENDIGRRIQQFREKLGLNQGEFSREIKISQTTVSRVESGEKKTFKGIFKCADGSLCG